MAEFSFEGGSNPDFFDVPPPDPDLDLTICRGNGDTTEPPPVLPEVPITASEDRRSGILPHETAAETVLPAEQITGTTERAAAAEKLTSEESTDRYAAIEAARSFKREQDARALELVTHQYSEEVDALARPAPGNWGDNETRGAAQNAGWEYLGETSATYDPVADSYGPDGRGNTIIDLCSSPIRPLNYTESMYVDPRTYVWLEESDEPHNPYGGKYATTATAPPLDPATGRMADEPVIRIPAGEDGRPLDGSLYVALGVYALRAQTFLEHLQKKGDE